MEHDLIRYIFQTTTVEGMAWILPGFYTLTQQQTESVYKLASLLHS